MLNAESFIVYAILLRACSAIQWDIILYGMQLDVTHLFGWPERCIVHDMIRPLDGILRLFCKIGSKRSSTCLHFPLVLATSFKSRQYA